IRILLPSEYRIGGRRLSKPKLTLNIRNPTDGKSGDNLAKAAKKKRSNNETMDEAWARIFDMKNSASDERRLREVKEAMEKGIIGRESGKAGKSRSEEHTSELQS